MMVRRIACLGAFIVIASLGCGRDRPASRGAGESAAAGPLVLLLDAPATARAGDEVPIAVTVVNRGAAPESVGGTQPDVVVMRADGGEADSTSTSSGA